ncbi:hypothetical protein ACFXAS_17745 [Streptomyces sp. NPDC059459]|uniref:hypothetical protein n=1 Tax=Streptomyces sp. NPDC059459 TaxID=3346839 RepID=UPI00368D461D
MTLLRELSPSAFPLQGEGDGSVAMHLVVDREAGTIHPADEDGHAVGDVRLDLHAGKYFG